MTRVNTTRRSLLIAAVLALVGLVGLVACSPPPKPPVPPTGHVVDSSITMPDGTVRTLHTYVPPVLPTDRPVALLLAFHGGYGWGTQFESTTGFDGLADANEFVVSYLDGTPIPHGPTADGRVWNAGACCGIAAQDRDDVDDIDFVRRAIESLKATYDVDPARVFVTGHSNGGMLGYRIACELGDEVSAIAVQSTTLEVDPCRPSQPVPFLHIHGTADDTIPIDGGVGTGPTAGIDFNSPIASIQTMAGLEGCTAMTESADPANAAVTIDRWSGCSQGSVVEMVKVSGAGHGWMGSASPKAFAGFHTSEQVWAFLAAHPRTPS